VYDIVGRKINVQMAPLRHMGGGVWRLGITISQGFSSKFNTLIVPWKKSLLVYEISIIFLGHYRLNLVYV
jgi:hypothetical protein